MSAFSASVRLRRASLQRLEFLREMRGQSFGDALLLFPGPLLGHTLGETDLLRRELVWPWQAARGARISRPGLRYTLPAELYPVAYSVAGVNEAG